MRLRHDFMDDRHKTFCLPSQQQSWKLQVTHDNTNPQEFFNLLFRYIIGFSSFYHETYVSLLWSPNKILFLPCPHPSVRLIPMLQRVPKLSLTIEDIFNNVISIQMFKTCIVIISIQSWMFSSEFPATLYTVKNCPQNARRGEQLQ